MKSLFVDKFSILDMIGITMVALTMSSGYVITGFLVLLFGPAFLFFLEQVCDDLERDEA